MPTFDYQCKVCKLTHLDEHVKNSEVVFECYKCQGECEKLVSACSFKSTGRGFYSPNLSIKKRDNDGTDRS